MMPDGHTGFERGAPSGLIAALETRGATIERGWREARRAYAMARTTEGRVFARYSDDPADRARLDHEAQVRAVVGVSGALRAPPVLARGAGWMVERAIDSVTLAGLPAVESCVAATRELMQTELPTAGAIAGGGKVRGLIALLGLTRATGGRLRPSDVMTGRRELARTSLPEVSCHRDFHLKNLLFDGSDLWVIDWERCGRGPAGLDLLQLWATLPGDEDREALFERTVELVGRTRRPELVRLRFGVVVATIAGMIGAREEFNRDPVSARRLLGKLPELRREMRQARAL